MYVAVVRHTAEDSHLHELSLSAGPVGRDTLKHGSQEQHGKQPGLIALLRSGLFTMCHLSRLAVWSRPPGRARWWRLL